MRTGGACPLRADSQSCSPKRPWTEAVGRPLGPWVSKPRAVWGTCNNAEVPAGPQAQPSAMSGEAALPAAAGGARRGRHRGLGFRRPPEKVPLHFMGLLACRTGVSSGLFYPG